MAKQTTKLPVSVFRGIRLCLHLVYGVLLAVPYPHIGQAGQNRILKTWNRQLLAILNISLQIKGQQPVRGNGGCLIVANHVSWLDIIVLNAIHPSRFIAKSEVRDWPMIGWLCRRCGTVFIERAMRRNASLVNRQISHLLKQDVCIGLFPEGTTTDGKQVGHFHSALIQPAIDAGIRLLPIALRYQDRAGVPAISAVFVGEMTLAQSIWQILRCAHQDAMVVYTPALMAENANRRVLARAAHEAISHVLQTAGAGHHAVIRQEVSALTKTLLSSRSAYGLLVDPLLNQLPK